MATMAQAIKEAFGERGGALSREAIKQSVESRYPGEWQPATLRAHLYACAVNNSRAYVHHPNAERFLYKLADGGFELYEEEAHGPNLWSAGVALDDREAVVDEAVSKSFSAGRIVLEVVPAAGSDGFAGSHAGTPARLIVRAARRDPGAFALAGGRKSDGAAGKQAGAPVF